MSGILCLSVDCATVVQYFVCICKCVNPSQGSCVSMSVMSEHLGVSVQRWIFLYLCACLSMYQPCKCLCTCGSVYVCEVCIRKCVHLLV